MTDIVKLRTGYAVKVSVLRVGFAGPPGADGSVYDDTPILARIAAVEQSIATLPTPYDYAALAGRVAALEGASASVAWTDIVGKPAAFPPTAHRHDASQIDNLPVPAWADITGKPSAFPPAAHSHPWSDLTGVPTEFPPSAHPHTIGDVSGLQTALTTANDTLAALQAEIAEARAQLSAVSTFAAPNAGGIVPGRYYDNATSSSINTNYTSGADRVDMGLFITSRPLSVDQIGFTVATAGSAAYGRAFVYEAGADGWPSNLIFEGNDDLDLNGANFRGHTLASPITFEANKVYWVGWRFGAATTYAVLRGINVSSAPNLGIGTVAGNTYCTVLRRSIPFATRMPATWGFVESELTANVPPPSIRMRAT